MAGDLEAAVEAVGSRQIEKRTYLQYQQDLPLGCRWGLKKREEFMMSLGFFVEQQGEEAICEMVYLSEKKVWGIESGSLG